jgi:hypothetical protein
LSSEAGLFYGLYETVGPNGLWIFVLVTLVMGGAAAVAAGRAVADGWSHPNMAALYAALLAAAVRFIQYAVFNQPLLSLPTYLIDFAFLLFIADLAFRHHRTTQMVRQYPWLYQKSSPITWRNKATGT